MPKIRFLVDRTLRDEYEGTDKQTVFAAGKVVTVNESSAAHWIDRGVAELVVDEKPKLKVPAKKQTPNGEMNDGDV